MKLLPLALLLVAGGWLAWIALSADPPTYVAPSETVPAHLSGAVPAGTEVRRFQVDGMCCEGCPRKLYGKLEALAGVREAAVDLETGVAAVVVERDVPDARLVEVLAAEPKYTVQALP